MVMFNKILQTWGDLVIAYPKRALAPVHRPHYIDGFSVVLVLRSKATCAGNGHSLTKHGNAAAGHQNSALRVSGSAPLDGVAPLAKGMTISGKTRLARHAEPSH